MSAKKTANNKKRKNFKKAELHDVLIKTYKFFELEKKYGAKFVNKPLTRLSKATGLSCSTLKRKIKEPDAVQDVVDGLHKLEEEKKVKIQRSRKLDNIDDNILITQAIDDLKSKSATVTSPRLQRMLKDKGVDVSLSTVTRTLKRLGYRFNKKHASKGFLSPDEAVTHCCYCQQEINE